jgi:hypothetical protein
VTKFKPGLTVSLAISLFMLLAGPALAKDRNHDRLPDRWERHHHLSLHHKQARRDQDHDGLDNRGEHRAHTNPRDRDSDDDGIMDGDENAGTIQRFHAGVLTIALAGGGTISAKVGRSTEIKCEATASATSGGDDPAGDDNGGHGNDDPAGHDDGHDCGTDALTVGRTVREADIRVRHGRAVYREIELGDSA